MHCTIYKPIFFLLFSSFGNEAGNFTIYFLSTKTKIHKTFDILHLKLCLVCGTFLFINFIVEKVQRTFVCSLLHSILRSKFQINRFVANITDIEITFQGSNSKYQKYIFVIKIISDGSANTIKQFNGFSNANFCKFHERFLSLQFTRY